MSPNLQYIRIVVKILPWCIMIPARVLMVALSHRVRKPNNAFFIDISDKATAFATVRAADFAAIAVLL